jgi:hypothetical protein
MIILAAWLTKKINSPWLAAGLGLVLIGLGIYGLANDDMPTIIAILIIVVGVINMCRLLPKPKEQDPGKAASEPPRQQAGRP